MSALDILGNVDDIEVSEGDISFRVQTYQPEIMFPKISKLKVFCFIPTKFYTRGAGLVLVSAKTLKDAKIKLANTRDDVKFIGEVSTLQELLDVLRPHSKIFKRKDVWYFLHLE